MAIGHPGIGPAGLLAAAQEATSGGGEAVLVVLWIVGVAGLAMFVVSLIRWLRRPDPEPKAEGDRPAG